MMRAKMQVSSVTQSTTSESVTMNAVCGTGKFGPEGESEDNTYARYTPTGTATLQITNPALIGQIKPGQKFYVDFTPAE